MESPAPIYILSASIYGRTGGRFKAGGKPTNSRFQLVERIMLIVVIILRIAALSGEYTAI